MLGIHFDINPCFPFLVGFISSIRVCGSGSRFASSNTACGLFVLQSDGCSPIIWIGGWASFSSDADVQA